ncbi:MAG: Calx-beta domain-containing protein, partial [Pyrinomonadaceae bacterium]
IQLGTPNAGSPLADAVQGILVGFTGVIPTVIINGLAGPAGVQLTRPYMNVYNRNHRSNSKVRYLALAGNYDPDCFFLNPFCRPIERFFLLITGPGDTIVPISSVHALSYTEKRIFSSSGANKDATHTSLNAALGVYNSVRDRVEVFGTDASVMVATPPTILRTAAAIGSIHQGQLKQQTIPVDQATSTTFALMYPSGNLDLALVSPSGQRFDANTVIGNPDVTRDEAEIIGGMMEIYTFKSPEVGVWTVETTAPSVTEPSGEAAFAINAWLETPAITFSGALEQQSVHTGDALKILGTLKNNNAPLTGASVNAKVALPDNSTLNVALKDDGTGGDAAADDGIYTGTLTNTTQSGNYRISLTAGRAASSGASAFSREDYALGTVSSSHSTIAGPFHDFGQDTDSDGFFNSLVVQVGVNATAAGNYKLTGTLKDANGNTQDASVSANLNVGLNTVSLLFDGETIFNNRVDGPYQLVSVHLAEENNLDVLEVDERTNALQTAAYSFRQFQHNAINLTGSGSTEGIDTNSNGRFDQLKVGIGIEVATSGTYNWSARLTDRNGKELGFASNSGSLSAGANTIFLTFDGTPIGSNGVDGPYFIRGLLIFGTGDSLVTSDAFTTSALHAIQFEGFTANADLSVTQNAAPSPVLTGSNITYTTTVTNNGPSPADSVGVADTLPANTAFVSCTTTDGVCGGSGNARTISINSIASGASVTITLVASVDCSLADGTAISNTAAVTSTTPDQDPLNNSVTSTVIANAGQRVHFSSPTFNVTEGDTSVAVNVTRTCNTSTPVTVDYATSDGTALQKSDYTIAQGQLSFAAGETSKTISILINEDAYVEGDETLTLTLSNASVGTILDGPSTATLTITDNDTGPPTTNPADEAAHFVDQQYHDFLNRTPDPDGFAYWTGQINACGTNVQCIHDRRIAVADAFFFEPEFQQTGAFVYRLYKAGLGSNPTYAQFMSYRGSVVAGSNLDQSKTASALRFAQSAAFRQAYPQTLTAIQFVDTLLNTIKNNSNVDLSAQRNSLIGLYDGTDSGRAAILRQVADSQPFIDAEYNSSFVLMEYYGYLRRDYDQAGFDFWLGQVNKYPLRNVQIQHAMACSFITSAEYQLRFSSVITHSNSECPQ